MIVYWTGRPYWQVLKEVGSKLVGLTYDRKRPDSVSFSKEELKYLVDNPQYLKVLINALR